MHFQLSGHSSKAENTLESNESGLSQSKDTVVIGKLGVEAWESILVVFEIGR